MSTYYVLGDGKLLPHYYCMENIPENLHYYSFQDLNLETIENVLFLSLLPGPRPPNPIHFPSDLALVRKYWEW